jgi:acetoacetate decarboxylase
MGPINDQGKPPNGIYREFQCLSIQYETDTDAIQALLPDCYQPTENPLVTAMFGYYDGVDFMAGRGYRIASFMVAARFDGEKDHIEGDYVLVMYEDDAFPIMTGHALQGIHKT